VGPVRRFPPMVPAGARTGRPGTRWTNDRSPRIPFNYSNYRRSS
jgi:hypothetical protein